MTQTEKLWLCGSDKWTLIKESLHCTFSSASSCGNNWLIPTTFSFNIFDFDFTVYLLFFTLQNSSTSFISNHNNIRKHGWKRKIILFKRYNFIL